MIASSSIRGDLVLGRARAGRLSRALWLNGPALEWLFGAGVPDETLSAVRPGKLMEKLLLRCFSLDLIVQDPDPRLPTNHRSARRNWRKQLLIPLVLLDARN